MTSLSSLPCGGNSELEGRLEQLASDADRLHSQIRERHLTDVGMLKRDLDKLIGELRYPNVTNQTTASEAERQLAELRKLAARLGRS